MCIRDSKSMCSSSRGFEDETTFLGLKEFLICFPFWHASLMWSFSNLSLGNPITKFFEINLFKWFMWMWAILLCHNQDSSCLEIRQPIEQGEEISKRYIVDSFTNQHYFLWVGKVNLTRVWLEDDIITLVTQLTNADQTVL